jgi:DNA repair/transcription protein MET18/MMS19
VALNTLQVITTELSMGVSLGGSNDPVEKFLHPIITDCMTQLQKPELKLAKPSGKILKACAMASGMSGRSYYELNLIDLYTN